jgi:hypothetical protein
MLPSDFCSDGIEILHFFCEAIEQSHHNNFLFP